MLAGAFAVMKEQKMKNMQINILVLLPLVLMTACGQEQNIAQSQSTITATHGSDVTNVIVNHYYRNDQNDKVYLLSVGPFYHEIFDCESDETINEIMNTPHHVIKENAQQTGYNPEHKRADLSCDPDQLGGLGFFDFFYLDDSTSTTFVPTGVAGEYYLLPFDAPCMEDLQNILFKLNRRLDYGLVNMGVPSDLQVETSLDCGLIQPPMYEIYGAHDGKIGMAVILVYRDNGNEILFPVYRINSQPINPGSYAMLAERFGIAQAAFNPMPAPRDKVYYDLCLDPTQDCQFAHRHYDEFGDPNWQPEPLVATPLLDEFGKQTITISTESDLPFVGCDKLITEELGFPLEELNYDERAWIEQTNTRLMLEQDGLLLSRPQFACKNEPAQTPGCLLTLGTTQTGDGLLGYRFSDTDLARALFERRRTCGPTELTIQLQRSVILEMEKSYSIYLGLFESIEFVSQEDSHHSFEVVEICNEENPCFRAANDTERTVFFMGSYTNKLSIENVDFSYRALNETVAEEGEDGDETVFFNLKTKLFEVTAEDRGTKTKVIIRNCQLGTNEEDVGFLTDVFRGESVRLFADNSSFLANKTNSYTGNGISLNNSSLSFIDKDGTKRITGPAGAIRLLGGENSVLVFGGTLSGSIDFDPRSKTILTNVWLEQMPVINPGLANPILSCSGYEQDHAESYHLKITGDSLVFFNQDPADESMVQFLRSGRVQIMGGVQYFYGGQNPIGLNRISFCDGQGSVKVYRAGMEPERCQQD